MTTLRLVIHGRVQGVWFRAWTCEEARKRRLSGWVRNRRDGTVEVAVRGPDALVDELVRVCHEGPPMAQVLRVDRFAHDEDLEPGFHQWPTV